MGTELDAGATLRKAARRLRGTPADWDPLLARIRDARLVLLGEATHGTHEFYRARAEITRRLIRECGFSAIAVEADWPDALRVNRYVCSRGDDPDAVSALGGFRRYPTWMWRNADIVELVNWLREHNARSGVRPVGFYGLDLYALHRAMELVLAYLERVDPAAACRARARYACFSRIDPGDGQAYGRAVMLGLAPSCQEEALAQLRELERRAPSGDEGEEAEDERFYAEQNARLVKSAEEYYRTMFRGHIASWNLRDGHMAETLEALAAHLERRGGPAKIVVWAHNSHLGDARATDFADIGELNLGQLVRQRVGSEAFLVGFTTFEGTVTAASDWDEPPRRQRVRPALTDSVEALLREGCAPAGLLLLGEEPARELLRAPRLERAIGVVYRPDTERQCHYFSARLSEQFDAVIHYDVTRALEPIDRGVAWREDEPPETFPSAL